MSRAQRPPAARFAAAFHTAAGRFWWRCRALRHARRHLELALLHGADAFETQVRIGRVAHAQGDFLGWRRACHAAREQDPARFARLTHPFSLFDGNARPGPDLRPRLNTGPRFTSSSVGMLGTDALPEPTAAHLSPSTRDDCVDHGERDRFRQQGPIGEDEVASVDLDDLGRRLTST